MPARRTGQWVMLIGAVGLSLGLTLFGPKLIRTVGEQITRLNPMRAFCVALSAAITVIAASALGLPVSSTHTAVDGIFGIGVFREWREHRRCRVPRREVLLSLIGQEPDEFPADMLPKKQAKKWAKAERRKLVRRIHALTIGAAWIVTVPAAALLSAVLFLLQRQILSAWMGGHANQGPVLTIEPPLNSLLSACRHALPKYLAE